MKKKLLIIILILIIIILRILFGELNITNKLGFNNNLTYDIKVNDSYVTANVEEKKETSIIPFLINIISYNIIMTKGDELVTEYKTELGNNIILNIKAYKCFSTVDNKNQIECNYDTKIASKRLLNNIDYKMKITSTKMETIYNGEFINDITDILKEKEKYQIEIYSNYKNITSAIYFYVELV